MRKQDKVIMWPAYFDSSKSRVEGRRVAKTIAVASPRIAEIKEAADKLGFSSELVPDSGYPKMPHVKAGMLLVEKKGSKNQTVNMIGKQLLKMRSIAQPRQEI